MQAVFLTLVWIVCYWFCLPVYAVGKPPIINLPKSTIESAIDFHIHSSPEMKALVLKNHFASTAGRAVLVNKIVPQIEVFGGVVLNHAVGGINPDAVGAMHRIGGKYGKVVWLPTVDAEHHLQVFHKS
jgi:hypothetical protein